MNETIEVNLDELIGLADKLSRVDLMRIIDSISDDLEELIVSNLLKPTKTWDKKPNPKVKKSRKRNSYELSVEIDDENYIYVNMGTRPHTIRPVKAKVLSFNLTIGSKTRPNTLRSFNTRQTTQRIYTTIVYHSGSQPRNFDRLVVTIVKRDAPKMIEDAIKKHIKRRLR